MTTTNVRYLQTDPVCQSGSNQNVKADLCVRPGLNGTATSNSPFHTTLLTPCLLLLGRFRLN